jgi:hypothetical protein
VRSDCSRISGLWVEPRGLRAMMEFARGFPIVDSGLVGQACYRRVPAPVRPDAISSFVLGAVQWTGQGL